MDQDDPRLQQSSTQQYLDHFPAVTQTLGGVNVAGQNFNSSMLLLCGISSLVRENGVLRIPSLHIRRTLHTGSCRTTTLQSDVPERGRALPSSSLFYIEDRIMDCAVGVLKLLTIPSCLSTGPKNMEVIRQEPRPRHPGLAIQG